MKRFAVIVVIGALAVLGAAVPAGAQEPSAECDTGQVSPSTGPLPGWAIGFGVDQRGSALSVLSVRLCYAGLVHGVAPPAKALESVWTNTFDEYKGSVFIKVSPTGGLFLISADGDSSNAETLACADGFVGARGDSGGVHAYGSPDGDFTEASFSRAPEEIVADYGEGCTP